MIEAVEKGQLIAAGEQTPENWQAIRRGLGLEVSYQPLPAEPLPPETKTEVVQGPLLLTAEEADGIDPARLMPIREFRNRLALQIGPFSGYRGHPIYRYTYLLENLIAGGLGSISKVIGHRWDWTEEQKREVSSQAKSIRQDGFIDLEVAKSIVKDPEGQVRLQYGIEKDGNVSAAECDLWRELLDRTLKEAVDPVTGSMTAPVLVHDPNSPYLEEVGVNEPGRSELMRLVTRIAIARFCADTGLKGIGNHTWDRLMSSCGSEIGPFGQRLERIEAGIEPDSFLSVSYGGGLDNDIRDIGPAKAAVLNAYAEAIRLPQAV